jgi:cytochrome c556
MKIRTMLALLAVALLAVALLALAACAPPKNNTPAAEVPSLKSLEAVMDVQATTADPQFAKREQASFTDEELASMLETATKIDATSKHIKSFAKGAEFDAFADRLNASAGALSKAASAKDAAGVRAALVEMKSTCKACHSKLR